ncbi:MAG: hypothetical protein OYH77_06540 [Pseudomonadota bacterium]|nr:hypothetical protein [Pseudomonadota bacterium]
MASHMKRTRIRRAMKKAARGRKRKAKLQSKGSTPPRLPLLPTAKD